MPERKQSEDVAHEEEEEEEEIGRSPGFREDLRTGNSVSENGANRKPSFRERLF